MRRTSADDSLAGYRDTRDGNPLEMTAPIETGEWELRYVAGRSHTILGRAPMTLTPIAATLEAAPEVVLGGTLSVRWTGPNNAGDYVTLVARETPDGKYGNYTYTAAGSPLEIMAPPEPGEAELRYMTGQGNNVIGRRPVRITVPDVSLSAPARVAAGATVAITWTGPNNGGDYITIVERERPDGQYGNYTYTRTGSPLSLLMPLMSGEAELRYMSGQGGRVLARRAITLLPVTATLSASAEARAGTNVAITWTGPNYASDFITIVPPSLPDSQYLNYTDARAGSPLEVKAPAEAGDYEIRYVTGQGHTVIARRPIRIVP